MHPFVEKQRYTRNEVRLGLGATSGDDRFVVGADHVAVLAKLGDGDSDPHFSQRSEFRWPGFAPTRIGERGIKTLIFVERGHDTFELVRTGSPASYRNDEGAIFDVHIRFQPPLPRDEWLELRGRRAGHSIEPPPERELVELPPTATVDERWNALVTFVERWYGEPIERRKPPRARGSVGPLLVHSLRDLASQVPELIAFNQLVDARKHVVEDGKVVFLVENQGVCWWAAEPDGEDPRVWYRENDHRASWLEEPERLSSFLVQAMLFEAICHARFGGMVVSPSSAVLETVRTRLVPFGMQPWRWLGWSFYARDGALAMINNEDNVHLAAMTPAALSRFADLDTSDWEWVSF